MFKGAGATRPGIVEVIEAEGADQRRHRLRAHQPVRALKGNLGLAVTSDLMLAPPGPADLAREKQVVAEEIAEAADAPDDLVFELAQTRPSRASPWAGRSSAPASIAAAGTLRTGARPLRADPGGQRRRHRRRQSCWPWPTATSAAPGAGLPRRRPPSWAGRQ